ncbi:MAG: asparagine synthase (glutamine-hydrolyzing) [Planctomycetia bacterium]|nr:asparagine synthase (glutamine-hydrolyzing) [Planctomycetia bacterium]
MCGICGVVWTKSACGISADILDRMTDAMTRRGPDDRGVLYSAGPYSYLAPGADAASSTSTLPQTSSDTVGGLSSGLALGHRRLSIIDLTDKGRQPLANEDGSVFVTFNGEIYNFPALRQELLRKGHIFRTETDTEVLVHLYEEEGPDCVKRLSGMFAFAIWDNRKKQLILARDRMGKKPLFYRCEKDRLLFASELNSLFVVPGMPRAIDPLALDQYLTYQYVPFPRTIYEGINKLPPGTVAVWKTDGSFQVDLYWEQETSLSTERTPEQWQNAVRETVSAAVKDRLRSDVPLGAFLSGGLDSTIIVSLMQKFSQQPVRTYSIGFDHKEYDETDVARNTAARLGTLHREFRVTPDAEAIMPDLVRQYGEPFADSSAIPTWYLSEMTRREVTVALSGDGGDELFAGYDRYKAMRYSVWLDRIPRFGRQLLAGPVRALIPNSVRQRSILRRGRRFLEALDFSPLERYLQWIAIFNRQRKNALYRGDFSKYLADVHEETGYDTLDFLSNTFKNWSHRDLVTAVSMTDLRTYLPCDLMTKVDMASMRHSLEVRAPFLDNRVVDLASTMPIAYKLTRHKGKQILRDVFREYLPPELERRPKTGFGVPLDYWFRGSLNQLIHDVLLRANSELTEYFQPEAIETLLREHETKQFDHSARLWSLLVLQLWFDYRA